MDSDEYHPHAGKGMPGHGRQLGHRQGDRRGTGPYGRYGRGQAALEEIRTATGSQSAEMMLADLSSLDSVRALAEEYKGRHEHLHVLVNNAGAYYTKRHVTVDGLEAMFAVNYLAPFLLTNLLLDVLKASAPSRVINVAGAYHSRGRIDFDDLQGEGSFKGARANYQSKLADVLFTYELARRLEGAGVTANCLHPGIVATSLVEKDEDFPRLLKVLYKLFKPFASSPEKGAETGVAVLTRIARCGAGPATVERQRGAGEDHLTPRWERPRYPPSASVFISRSQLSSPSSHS